MTVAVAARLTVQEALNLIFRDGGNRYSELEDVPEQEDSMEGNSDYSLSEEADTEEDPEKQSQQLVLTSAQS